MNHRARIGAAALVGMALVLLGAVVPPATAADVGSHSVTVDVTTESGIPINDDQIVPLLVKWDADEFNEDTVVNDLPSMLVGSTFTLSGVPDGTYGLFFESMLYGDGVRAGAGSVWLGGGVIKSESTPVVVSGEDVHVAQELPQGSGIYGTTRSLSGPKYARMQIWVESAAGVPERYGRGEVINEGGYYTTQVLAEGSQVRVFVDPGNPAYVDSWLFWDFTYEDAAVLTTTTVDREIDVVIYARLISSQPKVLGHPIVGARLTVSRGTWTSGTSFLYGWYADGAKIQGAKTSSFTVTSAQLGKSISVRIFGSKAGYMPVRRESDPTTRIPRTAKPTIVGTAIVGRSLTAVAGTWSVGTTFTYQWFSNGAKIPGATAQKLTVRSAMVGDRISVNVTGAKPGYTTDVRTSASVYPRR